MRRASAGVGVGGAGVTFVGVVGKLTRDSVTAFPAHVMHHADRHAAEGSTAIEAVPLAFDFLKFFVALLTELLTDLAAAPVSRPAARPASRAAQRAEANERGHGKGLLRTRQSASRKASRHPARL